MKKSLSLRALLLVLALVLTMIPMFAIGASAAEQTATMAYTGSTTNMTGNNDAATVGLDENLFTVIGNKGSTSNNVGLNKAGQIRLYGHSSSGNGSYLTVTIAEGYVIKSIVNCNIINIFIC